MKSRVTLENVKIVPEQMMVDCASKFGPDEDNGFKTCIEQAAIFRMAGLTPVYLCSSTFRDLYVTSKESLKREYH